MKIRNLIPQFLRRKSVTKEPRAYYGAGGMQHQIKDFPPVDGCSCVPCQMARIARKPLYNEGGMKYPWRLVKSTKHKVMYFLKANYPNSYSGREIARATGLNTSQVGGALKHCGDHVKKVGTHVGPKGCVGFKWQGVLKERV